MVTARGVNPKTIGPSASDERMFVRRCLFFSDKPVYPVSRSGTTKIRHLKQSQVSNAGASHLLVSCLLCPPLLPVYLFNDAVITAGIMQCGLRQEDGDKWKQVYGF